MQRTDIKMTHVPFRGAAPLVQEIIGGRIDIANSTLPSVLEQINAGTLRAIALASPERNPRAKDIPTLREQGVSDADADSWAAFFAPAATPAARRPLPPERPQARAPQHPPAVASALASRTTSPATPPTTPRSRPRVSSTSRVNRAKTSAATTVRHTAPTATTDTTSARTPPIPSRATPTVRPRASAAPTRGTLRGRMRRDSD